MHKIFREAERKDIAGIQRVRNAVKENRLTDPALVPDKDVEEFMFYRGKGWVCEVNNQITGFAIADLTDNNIWALFVDPAFEKNGIGKELHDLMLDWYFGQKKIMFGLEPHPVHAQKPFTSMPGGGKQVCTAAKK